MYLLLLALAGLCETVMVYTMRKSAGFKVKSWSVLTILVAICSLTLLSIAMTMTEVRIAYGIWVALGSIGSLLIGTLLFKERLNLGQWVGIICIIIAVIGLKMTV